MASHPPHPPYTLYKHYARAHATATAPRILVPDRHTPHKRRTMARSIRTVMVALFVVAVVSSSAQQQQQQQSASDPFDCTQSCVAECVTRKEEADCPGTCKKVCVEMEKIMAKAAARTDCPLQCYESCMIQDGGKAGKVGCTKMCMKFCKINIEAEFTAKLNPNTMK